MKRARQEKHRQAALSVSAREVGLSRFVTEGTAGRVGRMEPIVPARCMAQAMAAAAVALLTAGCAAPGG